VRCYTAAAMIKLGHPVPVDVEALLPCVVQALSRDDRIEALWLFGSRARNEADSLSDVDLAVLARADLDRSALWDAMLEWTGVATEALRTDEVCLQVLNRLSVAVRDAILRDARLLWSRSPEVAADFVAQTLKEYLDFEPYLKAYDRELFRQAAAGTLR
jgi:predicted nucleotidyltransferase